MTDQQLVSLIIAAVIVMLILVVSLVFFFNYSQKKILKEQELNHEQKMSFQKEMLVLRKMREVGFPENYMMIFLRSSMSLI